MMFFMQITDIVSAIKTRKGQNLKAVFGKSLKTRKGVTDVVEKVTHIVIRGGIEYDNTKAVMEGRDNGELPSENAGLPWGNWVEYPLHIEHKGVDYARFYPASGLHFEPRVEYFLNGVQVDKATIQPLCLASEFPNREEPPLAITVKAENVRDLLIH